MDFIKELAELALGSRLKRLLENLRRDVKEIYKEHGIDFEPFLMPTMNLLSRKKSLHITQIAEYLAISQPAATQFCNSLYKKGLLDFSSHSADQRKKEVHITEKGMELVTKLKPIWTEITSSIKDILQSSKHDLLLGIENFENQLYRKNLNQRVEEKFEKKKLPHIEIVEYSNELKEYIKELNYEWLTRYFEIEEHDKVSLSNPEKEIINKGGKIFYAKFKNSIVGTVSLMKIDNSTFEIAKMAVTEKFQGQGIGKKLLDHSINQAKKMGIKKLILYSNTILANALNLYFKSGFMVVPLDHSQYKRSNIKMELSLQPV